MKTELICIVMFVSVLAGAKMEMVNGNPKFDLFQEIPAGYEQYIHASDADLQWWKDAKFGVFMHWDAPSSLNFSEISWGYGGSRPGHPFVQKNPKAVSAEDYHNSYTRFNPVQFNADEWATMIKDSGAGYLVFTAKHHGGFCMFDSKYTEYDIMSTPFKRDICGELVKACKKQGIKVMFYYSQPDWTHPDYWTENHDRFIEYVHNQLEELTTNYGPIDGIWFDGLGKNGATWNTPELLKKLREATPGILVNDRCHTPNTEDPSKEWGDFNTPEQTVGAYAIDYPWESCISMGGGNWSWMGRDHAVLSYRTCLRMLISCAGGGGNLLLNTGPSSDGFINPPEKENYLKMGEWLGKYGESIYATQGGPYKPGPWGASTYRRKLIYLHVMQDLEDGILELPALPAKVKKAFMLTGGSVSYEQTVKGLTLRLSDQPQDAINKVVVLETTSDVPVGLGIETAPEHSLTHGAKLVASSNPEKAAVLVGGHGTEFKAGAHHKAAWDAAWGDKQPSLEIDLGSEKEISQIKIMEKFSRCREFSVAVKGETGEWRTIQSGTYLEEFSKRFKPFKARYVKLSVGKVENGNLKIQSFDIY